MLMQVIALKHMAQFAKWDVDNVTDISCLFARRVTFEADLSR